MDEFEGLLVEALQILEHRITAIEVTQQITFMMLHSQNNEDANRIANTFKNIAKSDKLETNERCREYLIHLAKHLNGDRDVPIMGLNKLSDPPDPLNPIPWLRGIIEGGANK
ncbi:MAG: hypothetical protein C4522_17955 [Desulfobacteraceae bacterium]|nr:MAG: hypothetical protein C4522_17955 [Desulfobacteraceae bacterium]